VHINWLNRAGAKDDVGVGWRLAGIKGNMLRFSWIAIAQDVISSIDGLGKTRTSIMVLERVLC